MTKDEFQKAVDDAITDCIRNDYSFGSYAYKVTEAVWPLLEAAEKERDWHAERYEDAMNECDALRTAVRHESDCVEAAKTEIKALRAKTVLRVPDAVMAALDNLDDYVARIEGNDRGACDHINLLRRYLLDATEVGENE